MSLFNRKIRPLEVFSILDDLMKAHQSLSNHESAAFSLLVVKINANQFQNIFCASFLHFCDKRRLWCKTIFYVTFKSKNKAIGTFLDFGRGLEGSPEPFKSRSLKTCKFSRKFLFDKLFLCSGIHDDVFQIAASLCSGTQRQIWGQNIVKNGFNFFWVSLLVSRIKMLGKNFKKWKCSFFVKGQK